MVGEDEDRPAFVEKVQEFADVAIRLLVEIFHPFFSLGNRVAVPFFVCQVFDEHMLFQIDRMIMREDHVNIFALDHIMDRFGLPVGVAVPAVEHAFRDERVALAADVRSWRWIADVFAKILVDAFWMGRCTSTAACHLPPARGS